MKKILPCLGLAAAIIVVAICFGGGQTWAQGNLHPNSLDCKWCIDLSDVSCGGEGCNEFAGTGCGVRDFTVPCEADYCVRGKIVCSGTLYCNKCFVCVSVYENGVIMNGMPCHQAGNPNPDCGGTSCEISCCGIPMKPGNTYRVVVCKGPCETHGYDCTSCPNECVAWAWVYAPGASCPDHG